MNTLEFVAQLVSALAWPLTTVALAAVFLRAAGRTGILSDLKARIQTLKAGPSGVEASFFQYGKSAIDSAIPTRTQAPPAISPSTSPKATDIRTDRPANLYWLGHDLSWTIDVALRGADRSVVLYGIRQALHHLNAVGLAGGSAAKWLGFMLGTLGEQADSLDHDQRAQIAQNLRAVVELVGGHFGANQPDFDPGPRVLGGGVRPTGADARSSG